MVDPLGPEVNLAPFWEAREQVRVETDATQMQAYRDAAAYWRALDEKLGASSASLGKVRKEMETNSGWRPGGDPSSAAAAFFARLDEGSSSVEAMRPSVTKARQAFEEMVEVLDNYGQAVDQSQLMLLQQEKVQLEGQPDMSILPKPAGKITTADTNFVQLPDTPTQSLVEQIVRSTVGVRDNLQRKLSDVAGVVNAVPAETWRGPTTYTGQWPGVGPPAANNSPGGPGGPAPGGPGGPAPGGPGGPAPGGPGGPAPGGATPGGPGDTPGSTPESGSPTSTSDIGTDQPGADTPGGPDLGDSPTSDTGLDTSVPDLPPPDPSLAGTPTPTPTVPPLSTSPLGDPSLGTIPSGLNSSTSGPSSSTFSLPPISSSPPPGRSSTMDSSGRPPAAGGSAAEPGPALARGPAGAQSGATTGSGFYPPMMPPMMPPGGAGAGGGGIRPGEAEFSGGMSRQAGRRDSWRAGLRSQLLGRTAERDDEEEPYTAPLSPPSGGEVLDEELWQVPSAAPVTPPESPPRRGRSWGP